MSTDLIIGLVIVGAVVAYVYWDRRRRGEPISARGFARDVGARLENSSIVSALGPLQPLRDLANALSRWELEQIADLIESTPDQQVERARTLARDLTNDSTALDRFKPAWYYQLEKRLKGNELQEISKMVEREIAARRAPSEQSSD